MLSLSLRLLERLVLPSLLLASILFTLHFRTQADAARRALVEQGAQFKQAQIDAQTDADAQAAQARVGYLKDAQDAQHGYEIRLADLARRSALAGVHRQPVGVQRIAQGTPSQAGAAGAPGGPAVPEVAAPETYVVSRADKDACNGAVAYGDSANDWALSLDPNP